MKPSLHELLVATAGALASVVALALAAGDRSVELADIPCVHDEDCAAYARESGAPPLCLDLGRTGRLTCALGLSPPPTADAAYSIALGRADAAADVAWMRTIQFVGAPHAEAVRFAGLERWVELITLLDPTFRVPYMYGAILLATSPDRAHAAERILLRGAEVFKGGEREWEWYVWLGWVRYFGLLDPESAADAYLRAGELGAPTYLAEFGEELRRDAKDCGVIWNRLSFTMQKQQEAGADAAGRLLDARMASNVLVHCWEEVIEAAAVAYKMERKTSASTPQELVDAGFLKVAPPAPPGQCWRLELEKVRLLGCGPQEGTTP